MITASLIFLDRYFFGCLLLHHAKRHEMNTNRLLVVASLVSSTVLGAWLALQSTPKPVRSLIPNMETLGTWHATVIGALVVNRDFQ